MGPKAATPPGDKRRRRRFEVNFLNDDVKKEYENVSFATAWLFNDSAMFPRLSLREKPNQSGRKRYYEVCFASQIKKRSGFTDPYIVRMDPIQKKVLPKLTGMIDNGPTYLKPKDLFIENCGQGSYPNFTQRSGASKLNDV